MVGDPDLSGPEKRSQARAAPQAEAQPSLQDDVIAAAGDVPQSQTGTARLFRYTVAFRRQKIASRCRRSGYAGRQEAARRQPLRIRLEAEVNAASRPAIGSQAVGHAAARRRRAAALLTTALLGTLVACSSGSHSLNSPATTRSTSAPATVTTSAPVTQSSGPALVTYIQDFQATPDSEPYDTQGVAQVNGVSYPNSQGAQFCFGSNERKWTYVLGRKYSSLQGTIGLSDNSVATAKIRFEILADGRLVYSKDLQVGQSTPLNVPVSNVLQLELDTLLLTQDGGCGAATGEWADIHAVGP
jgi:NPCBM/NEW2 domain